MKRVAIVTGGSSGIGLETAKALAESGLLVYDFSRREADYPFMRHIRCDVSDEAQVFSAVDQVLRETGRVDILVNNAGFGISGAFEFTDSADARRLMEVNLFGMSHMIRSVLPAMRAQRSGRIVNISSVAGVLAIPFQSWYSISKAAVRALTLSAANEVRRYGVGVCCVLPGDIRTGFTAAREKSAAGDDAYEGRIARSVSKMERDERGGMSPAAAGRRIAKIALKRSVKPEYTVGLTYSLIVILARVLPCRLVRFALEKLYAR